MFRREPAWWYASAPSAIPRLLAPAAHLYATIATRRLAEAPRYRSRLPVICVGNFTAGGTGKTPTTLMLADLLRADGHRPVILSRGYGGRLAGPHAVDPDRDNAADVGDEPLAMARELPVIVARDRPAGARAIEADPRGFTVILMDDGLQNPSLQKDVVIAVVDGTRGFGNGRIIPAGPLRAPLALQLGMADAIIINGGTTSLPRQLGSFGGPVLRAAVAPRGDVTWLDGARVVAYAGIGAPQRFFDLLATCKAILLDQVAFPDHHVFTDEDAEKLTGLAHRHDATLVTTEKDFARLSQGTSSLKALRHACRTLPISLTLNDQDQRSLHDLVLSKIATPPLLDSSAMKSIE